MSTDKAYKKAFEQWEKSQRNLEKQIELNIQNSKNMIEVHQEALRIQEKSLRYEKELLEKAIEEHNTYIKKI